MSLPTVRSQHGHTLDDLSRGNDVLVVFLRHSGCTFCRETLDDLARQRDRLADVTLALVHTGDAATGFFDRYGLADVDRFADADRALYRAFGLDSASLGQLLGPKVWWRGFQVALLKRHGFGVGGDLWQMPGVFVVRDGQVVAEFRHRSPADRPDYSALCSSADRGGATPRL